MSEVSRTADRAPRRSPATIVGAGVVVRGDIAGETHLRVRGMVVGKVDVSDLIVDDGAVVDGPIAAEAVTIRGRVIGLIKAKTVQLSASARVEGDVICDRIEIESGARFSGRCNAEDSVGGNVVAFQGASDETSATTEAGQELLRLAARLRRVTG